jgi:ParB family transcriptional regulator, chromosome partitioning protein
MSTRRSALGRGLGALIPTTQDGITIPALAPEVETPGAAFAELPIRRIVPNPDQPRRRFDADELERLADSIRRHGVLQPVVVRRSRSAELLGAPGAASEPRYELVVGERRWRASQLAGRETIPAVVADVAPRARLELALVENVQRRDLNPIELAHAFETLAASGATQEEIGARVGLDRSSVANHLRLLELPRELQGEIESQTLSLGHAKALLSISSPERQRALRDRIVRDALTVRQAEELARSLGAAVRKRPHAARPGLDPDTAGLIDALRDRLKTQVRMRGTAARGRLEVEYFGPEELHRIAALILGEA